MEEKENIKKELEEIAPELLKFKKHAPFSVYENYFEEFPTEIQKKVTANKPAVTLKQLPRMIWIPIAATLILFIGYGVLMFESYQKEHTETVSLIENTHPENNELNVALILDQVDIDEDLLIAEVQKKDQNASAKTQEGLEQFVVDNYDENSLLDNL